MSGSYKIPFFGIDRQYKSIQAEILEVTNDILVSGQVLDGHYTETFELTMARRTNRRHAISVNSGTQALIFALRCLKMTNSRIRTVLIPAVSYIATVNSVIESDLEPIFCDVDSVTGIIDLKSISVPTEDIDALMYVNLFGNCANYEQIKSFGTLFKEKSNYIIEDAAQSFGSSWNGQPSGNLGDISIFSFDPTKNLNNYGSGGMLLTDDQDWAELVKDFRNNGKNNNFVYSGTNSRMSEVDCGQMLVKLKYFDQWQQRRKEIAEYYNNELRDYVVTPGSELHELVDHSWSKYVIHHHDRSQIVKELENVGIESRIHYHQPLATEGVSFMSKLLADKNFILEGADEFCKTALSLPIYPELTDEEVEEIVSVIQYSLS